jgi:hypothetical protein
MAVCGYLAGRVLCMTSGGSLGVLPNDAEVGDVIVPFVLRPLADTEEFQFVEACYAHGVMDSELIDESGREARAAANAVFQEFVIR